MSIRLANISMYYGSLPALDGMSFTVEPGESVGLLGLPGSGKTSAVRIITGLYTPSQGKARIHGRDPVEPATRAAFGYLPQANPLPKDMRTYEYLYFRGRLKGLGRSAARTRARETAERVGASEFMDNLIGKLPAGPRRRIGLAETLLTDPPILVVDEPAGDLDHDQAKELRQLVKELTVERTLFLASGDLMDIERLCTRVLVMQYGRIIADGPTRKICQGNLEERRLTLEIIADEPIRETLRTVPGVKTIQVLEGGREPRSLTVRLTVPAGVDLRREIGAICARRGWIVTRMRLEPVALDDIFRRLSKPV